MELQIRLGAKPCSGDHFTVVTDKGTDGRHFYEEFANGGHAEMVVKACNAHEATKDVLAALVLLTQLLCHPGSCVTTKDIEQAKRAIADAGEEHCWGI